ncbi:MAG: 1,4-alpha-glucan branching enzyme, partial [Lachnospiraceae bacterium]|nr:1,4-alpha-glucan branching enzyme [Lachnospiraceae bacterium]
MTDRAYSYMDWAAIEGIVYSEEKHPKEIMAPQKVKEGILYQCFIPGAETVSLKETASGKTYEMVQEDEEGYFACVVPGKAPAAHVFCTDGKEYGDPYAYPSLLDAEELSRFYAGISERAYRLFGAHPTEVDGVSGMLFVLWAPTAMRVSVVGPFCDWDGRRYPMEFHEESGVYELFIPGLETGITYKYELKLTTGLVYTRPDPYASAFVLAEEPASIACETAYRWTDRTYMTARKKKTDTTAAPMAVYECSLASWKARAEHPEEETYRTLADKIADHAVDAGFTHVELLPIMEYADDASNGFHTTGYFAPTSRYGAPADFKYFVDRMHQAGLAVILDWTPAQFSPDTRWLADFDGTCLYEHLDPRQGIHPLWGTKLFNYGRPQVRSFLFSAAMNWIREYHVDGLRLDGCSTMLRLDYARGDRWVANAFGSWENLEGIDFLTRLSRIFKQACPEGLLMMAEDVDWPEVTAPVEEAGLGFDYVWNLHFTQDLLYYLSLSNEGRQLEHNVLTNAMLQNYQERHIVSLSRGIGLFDRQRFLGQISGKDQAQASLLRVAYAYLFMHPGKKLLTDGEEFNLPYLKKLLELYKSEKALWLHDYQEDGFEWINTMDSEHSVLTFLRKGDQPGETLLVVCNFSEEDFPLYQVGVPYAGSYKEILNSDSEE